MLEHEIETPYGDTRLKRNTKTQNLIHNTQTQQQTTKWKTLIGTQNLNTELTHTMLKHNTKTHD